mmetsp:Transcript_67227/g.118853  ORF Transcript_67227/g.118853 Transcript_67227/m.118853 type:complete len:95 (+) Transcript_67227:509-793(+)|eukprot:CAMPEP_0197691996 /NCGR_PEP_ID=MMETSP1338-20131121/110489_1 /TAXON_ID=43686 ORGANISM="Pelagodinium beii, Strain RCC1491" /NCGR_SAMPLE_ID=MMETSP1338 /ASSEMBLY_ACC=CAM_ASM_000754 /LENGTH=94 /DNA_ID=CAMNT_0043274607 /DNA_START=503 /DNA_END=787 /DNA_ORIENTATION=-
MSANMPDSKHVLDRMDLSPEEDWTDRNYISKLYAASGSSCLALQHLLSLWIKCSEQLPNPPRFLVPKDHTEPRFYSWTSEAMKVTSVPLYAGAR